MDIEEYYCSQDDDGAWLQTQEFEEEWNDNFDDRYEYKEEEYEWLHPPKSWQEQMSEETGIPLQGEI